MEFVVLGIRRGITYWLIAGMLLLVSAVQLLAQADVAADPDPKGAHLVVDETDSGASQETAEETEVVTIPQALQTTLSEHLADDDAYTVVGNSPQMNDVFGANQSGELIFVSSAGNGRVNGVVYRDEDILTYDPATSVWQLFFDASAVGITVDVNGFAFLVDGTLLLTLNESAFLHDVGVVQNTDVIRFIPTRCGA